jgi:hypothetical protein
MSMSLTQLNEKRHLGRLTMPFELTICFLQNAKTNRHHVRAGVPELDTAPLAPLAPLVPELPIGYGTNLKERSTPLLPHVPLAPALKGQGAKSTL